MSDVITRAVSLPFHTWERIHAHAAFRRVDLATALEELVEIGHASTSGTPGPRYAPETSGIGVNSSGIS